MIQESVQWSMPFYKKLKSFTKVTMKKHLFLSILFVLLIVSPQVCLSAPKVELVNPVFTFEPLPEGQALTHEFIIRNTGDAPLNILSVLPP